MAVNHGMGDRLPPYNKEAEQSVLGSMLRDNAVIDDVVQIIHKPEYFYTDAHQKIFQGIIALNTKAEPVDLVTLGALFYERKWMEDIGGPAYLAQIWDAAPTAANAIYYARIVRDKGILRGLIHANTEILRDAYDQAMPADELLGTAERKILEIAEMGATGETVSLKEALKEAYQRIDARADKRDVTMSGVPSGYLDLDEKTGGFQTSELIILAARPSVGKCLAHDSEIVTADGGIHTIEDLYKARQAELLTLGGDWKLSLTAPSAYVDDGVKPVYCVTTGLGRRVEATLSHPFLTAGGWRKLAELRVGDAIAVPRRVDVFGGEGMRECEVKLLAYFIGDGGLTDTCPEFTNGNPRLRDDFTQAIREFGGVDVRLDDGGGKRTATLHVRADQGQVRTNRTTFGRKLGAALGRAAVPARQVALQIGVSPGAVTHWKQGKCSPSPEVLEKLCAALKVEPAELLPDGETGARQRAANPVTAWLQSLGLWGKKAADKFIPAQVFRLPRGQVALFLNLLFATDGWATVLTAGAPQVGYCTVSERLARQVQHLLLRFGVIASLRKRSVRYRDGRRTAWQLDITDQEALRTFAREIGIVGKESAVTRVLEAMVGRNRQTNRDLIPVSVWDRIAQAKGTESWTSLARRMGLGENTNLHVRRRAVSCGRLLKFAAALNDDGLSQLAQSDVYWDRVVSIEFAGYKQVYDLTIPGTHNFVANDICVHNTAFVLNVIRNIIVEHHLPVFFVSLEQSRIELAERLLCCQSRVDSHKLRKGTLNSDDFNKIAEAGEVLSNSKLFIDDVPGQGLLRIAANARRLKRRHDIKLIAIDYLQLIEPENKRDSRQEQVAGISRRLKFLARELHIPVIALAQVNRGVEDRQDHKPRLSDLRECVPGDTPVVLSDGRRVPIRELVGACPEVLSLSPEGRIIQAQAECVWSVGRRPVSRVRLASGRTIRATGKHRLFGANGWVRVSELRAGDRLGVARTIPEPAQPEEYELRRMATSDLFWDRVVAVEPAGEEEVFDLTVPGPASWLADGIISHNSGAIEQDADTVMMLHRPDYHEPGQHEGVVEVIIAKQRNGPTGEVTLTYLKQFMKFENFAVEMPFGYEG